MNFWRRQDAQAALALHLTLKASDHALIKAVAFPLIYCNKSSVTLNSVWLGVISLRCHVYSMHRRTRRGRPSGLYSATCLFYWETESNQLAPAVKEFQFIFISSAGSSSKCHNNKSLRITNQTQFEINSSRSVATW